MFEFFRDLSDWIMDFADSDWSAVALALTSFSEAVFFPVPPDTLLIGIGILQPESAIWLAAIATVASVIGAAVGYWLGRRVGRPLLYRFASESKVVSAEKLFKKYGGWAVLVAAFTPIPYKVFAISAGVLDLNLRTFIIASVLGRGARFFLIGGMLYAFGDSIEDFINSNIELITGGGTFLLIVALVIVAIVTRRRGAKAVSGKGDGALQ
jgi:membrane protein YqaA with SNARE-associated domain